MTYEYKAGETYQTRDGRKARIYATDGVGNHPIHGAMKATDGWSQMLWSADGKYIYRTQESCDLLPPKRQVWVAVYCVNSNGALQSWLSNSKSMAEETSSSNGRTRIAVLGPIDVEAEP